MCSRYIHIYTITTLIPPNMIASLVICCFPPPPFRLRCSVGGGCDCDGGGRRRGGTAAATLLHLSRLLHIYVPNMSATHASKQHTQTLYTRRKIRIIHLMQSRRIIQSFLYILLLPSESESLNTRYISAFVCLCLYDDDNSILVYSTMNAT